ncbi:MAG: (d)CMP kinase [Chthonomonadaceae bacterium]|nr:(d)CMP kinase [Chthonomonadaceae bacterium]
MGFIVAIDGPAGAGKSTVAKRVATELECTYLDTGAMYRSIALVAQRQGISPIDEASLVSLARITRISFSPLTPDGFQRVEVNSEEVTAEIRTPEVSQLTSKISSIGLVREVVLEQQRRIAYEAPAGVVLEGRDIGTVVFPYADLKIFLTAGEEERARRRYEELKAQGMDISFLAALEDQRERDRRDSEREVAPLRPAEDSVTVVTDGLTVSEVVERILSLCRERLALREQKHQSNQIERKDLLA